MGGSVGGLVGWLVGCVEPSQPIRIISGLETNVNTFPITYSAQKSGNRSFVCLFVVVENAQN